MITGKKVRFPHSQTKFSVAYCLIAFLKTAKGHADFRRGRSCIDHIFVMIQILNKARERIINLSISKFCRFWKSIWQYPLGNPLENSQRILHFKINCKHHLYAISVKIFTVTWFEEAKWQRASKCIEELNRDASCTPSHYSSKGLANEETLKGKNKGIFNWHWLTTQT